MKAIAPAKINWTLEVLNRRDDGFHEIRSVMQTIDLCDELSAASSTKLSFESADGEPLPEDDLITRAGTTLARSLGGSRHARISLTKRVPVGAGLGGGSSDAAATLRLLRCLWAPPVSTEYLQTIAFQLSSDVPFFLHGGTALAEGRGERIAPLPDAPAAWLVLLAPPIRLPDKTKRMYEAIAPAAFSDGSRSRSLAECVRQGKPVRHDDVYNAFERVAYEMFDGLATYRKALTAAGAEAAHLCGAGPALFALTQSETDATSIAQRVQAPGSRVIVARTLTAPEATAITD